ncbi:MAG TPA: type VII secretion-associated protein [Mycobacterium sp.]|nr:type VII secretion-associated protein [Mycobacterium sp.]
MTVTVVEVGPVTVRGPNDADAEWVAAAIDGIDDELTLVDDHPVHVADVWRTVMRDVVGGEAETVVMVCPSWWASSRVQRVRDAASAVADDLMVLRRARVLSEGLFTIVEVAPEFVVVSSPDGRVRVAIREDTEAVLASIPMSAAVLLDGEVACPVVAALADRLRAKAVDVTVVDPQRVQRCVATLWPPDVSDGSEARPNNRFGRAAAVMAGMLLAAAALCGGLAVRHVVQSSAATMPMTLMVEGRVGVMVPARWRVQRITTGPGSARVQIVSADDARVAVHVTQSQLPVRQSLAEVAESLRAALSQEPDGVFVDFTPSDVRAGTAVATYREIRADHAIAWFVLIDGGLRIAIGCQSAPGLEEVVREVCDQAIRSAHAVF